MKKQTTLILGAVIVGGFLYFLLKKPKEEMRIKDGLVSYWKCDETSGTNMADVVGGNDVTRDAETTVTSSGKINYGIALVDNALSTFATPIRIRTNDFSFSLWINSANFGKWTNSGSVIGPSANFGGVIIGSSYDTDNKIAVWVGDGSSHATNVNDLKSPDNYSIGVWYHVVMTREGTTVILYVNGVNKATGELDANYDIGGASPYQLIGNHNGTYAFNGSADEIGYWNRALKPNEVTALYNNGNGLPYPFLIGPFPTHLRV